MRIKTSNIRYGSISGLISRPFEQHIILLLRIFVFQDSSCDVCRNSYVKGDQHLRQI